MRLPIAGRSELDGQVADAAAGIEPPGRDDRAGGTGLQTALAAAAVLARGLRGRQGQIGVERAKEEHRAAVAVEQQRVLAAPAQAGAPGELDLEHRRRVAEYAPAKRSGLFTQPPRQPLETGAHHLVIVAAQRVARDIGALVVGQRGPGAIAPVGIGGRVVHGHHDRAQGAGHQLGRTRPAHAVTGHIIHLAVKARGQPLREPGLGFGQIDVGDASRGKAQLARPARDAPGKIG